MQRLQCMHGTAMHAVSFDWLDPYEPDTSRHCAVAGIVDFTAVYIVARLVTPT
jgi:hypothetical protein